MNSFNINPIGLAIVRITHEDKKINDLSEAVFEGSLISHQGIGEIKKALFECHTSLFKMFRDDDIDSTYPQYIRITTDEAVTNKYHFIIKKEQME